MGRPQRWGGVTCACYPHEDTSPSYGEVRYFPFADARRYDVTQPGR